MLDFAEKGGYISYSPVDLHHRDESVLDRMDAEYRAALPGIATELKLELEEKYIWKSPAVKFAANLIDCVREGAKKTGHTTRDGERSGPRRGLHRARRPYHDDLCALPRRHFAQRGGIDHAR